MNSIETINLTKDGSLDLIWDGGERQTLPSTYLRGRCNCAQCKAHKLKNLPPVQFSDEIKVVEIQGIGTYGVQLVFSDGHDRGIYPWSYLLELGHTYSQNN